jgi:mannose-6-phosphate isomerase-like protein (cupin superfamily)
MVVAALGIALKSNLTDGSTQSPSTHRVVDKSNAEHYVWGEVSEGWRLLNAQDLSVIRERVPPGAGEIRHRHLKAHQFFFILSGTATIEFEDGATDLGAGQGVEIAPGLRHRFVNRSNSDVEFLTISAPTTKGDRVED